MSWIPGAEGAEKEGCVVEEFEAAGTIRRFRDWVERKTMLVLYAEESKGFGVPQSMT